MAVNIIVETGAGLASSNSYAAVADADTYFTDRGNASWLAGTTDAKASSLIRATAWLDGRYRGRYPGYRTLGRAQGLEWPRVGAYTYDPDNGRSNAYAGGLGYYQSSQYLFGYNYIASNIVPHEVVSATCEGAARELFKAGSLAPDLKRGGAIHEVHAGSVGVTYESGSNPNTVFQVVDLILASLLMGGNPYSSRLMRG